MSNSRRNAAGLVFFLLEKGRSAILAPALCFLCVAFATGAAQAQSAKLYSYDGKFEDAVFEVESAIVDRGLVVDYVSHVGEMLKRTKADVGGAKEIFQNADVFLFCSAVLSREMMEADPTNVAHCPYSVFVMESGDGSGTVQIGYRTMPEGPMKKVEALLDEIARSVAGK